MISSVKAERFHRELIYKSIAGDDKLMVSQVARLLERRALYVNSVSLTTGVHSPSEIYSMNHRPFSCPRGSGDSQLFILEMAIQKGDVSNFLRNNDSSLDIPPEESYFEIRNRPVGRPLEQVAPKRKDSYGGCFPRPECSLLHDFACKSGPPVVPPIDFAVHDFEYIIAVKSEIRDCCENFRRSIDPINPRSFDLDEIAAAAQRVEADLDLAPLLYSDHEVMKLLFLLPLTHKWKDKKTATGLSEFSERYISSIFDKFSAQVMGAYKKFPLPPPSLSFDLQGIDNKNRLDYGGWYDAFSFDNDPMVYVDPLLARAPFFACYNSGVSAYLRSKYNFIKILKQRGWQSFTDEDVRGIAELHAGNDELFKNCVQAQMIFIFAHEMGHKLVDVDGDISQNRDVLELRADCFAYMFLQGREDFDLTIFEQVVTKNPNATKDTAALGNRRIHGLRKLAEDFGKLQIARSGNEVAALCRRIVKN